MWHFPLINPKQLFDLEHYAEHVLEEIEEYRTAESKVEEAKEVVDVLHAAETLVRKYFERNPDVTFEEVRDGIIKKNKDRSYYDY